MSIERELPQMMATSLASNTTGWTIGDLPSGTYPAEWNPHLLAAMQRQQSNFDINQPGLPRPPRPAKSTTKEKLDMSDTAKSQVIVRRLVQVFIADPDENVPLDKALLYSGEQQLTDLSDQELFFDIDISGILKRHNELRVTLSDRSIKSKTVHLEPARIRDLKMTVVTIASF